MSRIFTFRYNKSDSSRNTWLIIFSTQELVPEDDFWDCLAEDIGQNLKPDAIIIITPGSRHEEILSQVKQMVSRRDEWRINIDIPISVVGFDKSGRCANISGANHQREIITDDLFLDIKHQGMREIFLRREGLIRPGQASHFVHPSGKHSAAFMRAANLMVCGPEVLFLAMCALQWLDTHPKYVWVDTSTVAPIVQWMIILRGILEPDFKVPTVTSFRSYDGLQSGFTFSLQEESIVVVSASSSGSLARFLIREYAFRSGKIITLFSTARNKSQLNILCDLAGDPSVDPDHARADEEYAGEKCVLCEAGSKPVHFVGDQFLADAISFEPEMILADDAPKNLSGFMERYSRLSAFKVWKSGSNARAANALYIDAEKLLNAPGFLKKFTDACERFIPASTRTIVHLNDDGAHALALIAVNYIKQKLNLDVELINCADLRVPERVKKRDGSVLIVAACIGTGGSLQSVSRDLRDIVGDNPKVYIVGIAKHAHLPRYAYLKKDLAHSSRAHRHEVIVLEELHLPQPIQGSSWELELQLLDKLTGLEAPPEIEVEATGVMSARSEAIREMVPGTCNNLFWGDANGNALALRPTFAFWKFQYAEDAVSQGDVYFTIASVLEEMRTGLKPKLRHSAFHQSLLSPSVFGRYNDGVIQASLLRSAFSQELNYATDPTLSADISRILKRVFVECSESRGEAAAEFLIAIATGRMRLLKEDLITALDSIPQSAGKHIHVLATYCKGLK